MAWQGFRNYGYDDVARRLAYRWLYTYGVFADGVRFDAFVDFNGVVPEKFDIVTLTHHVKVEYGNVGIDFKYVPREGFGWMNASYQVGLSYLTSHMRRALGALTAPDQFFSKSKEGPGRFHTLNHLQVTSPAVAGPAATALPNGALPNKFSNASEGSLTSDEEVEAAETVDELPAEKETAKENVRGVLHNLQEQMRQPAFTAEEECEPLTKEQLDAAIIIARGEKRLMEVSPPPEDVS
ncbi:MAG: trehalase-domain-containing protein [Olpidium bornovanus]|uniref:alpha,alpha-trehalase n=1 Tax=Olpidium bornovanus TaxID=278681 RepID=A0A8H8DIG0_9FUNG|nr:MAG: trehalase-domain-containing protein [Olpidium bornovanus]